MIKAETLAKGILALSKIHDFAKQKSLDKLSGEDIAKEIDVARKTF